MDTKRRLTTMMMRQTTIYMHLLILCFALLWGVSDVFGANTYDIIKPTETVGVCPDELPYYWRNKGYERDGIYHDTITRPAKRPSRVDTLEIYTLEFFTHPIRTVHAEIAEGSTLSYRGKKYTEEGLFYDTIHGGECDSIVRLYISYAEYFHMYDTAHVCEGGSYKNWRGRTLTIPGNYFDSLTSVNGKDSIYQMTLVVHYPEEGYDTVRVCPTEPHYYYWHGKRYNNDGDYTMSFKSPYGCDSIAHLHLEFLQEPQPTILTEYFCENIGVVIDGAVYHDQITLIDTFPGIYGCDSIVETRYIPRPTQFFEQVIQHYEGDPVVWRDSVYTKSGIYHDSLINVFGCDSVYRLRLVPKSDTYITINVCEGQSVEINGTEVVITEDVITTDTLHNSMGGDSIIHTTYNFNKRYIFREYATLCANKEFEWHGMTIGGKDVPGQEIVHKEYKTASGCDSIYELEVTYLAAPIKDSVIIWCRDSLIEKGPIRWKNSRGEWQEWSLYQMPDGSIIDTTIRDTMLNTRPGKLEYTDGTEIYTGGCDSIFNLRIVITDRCSKLDSIPLCYGGSVTVDSKVYTQPGRYFNTMPSSKLMNLQDSTHTFLIYYVYPTEETIDTTVCELALPINYNGKKITAAGTYDFHLATKYGCDSLVHLRVSVIPTKYSPINEEHFCPDQPLAFHMGNGRVITQPGDYNDTIPWEGCDSIIRYRILWAPTHYYADTAYFKPGTSYKWHQNGQERLLDTDGIYWDSCKNVYGCDSVYYLRLIEAQPFFMEVDPVTLCTSELPWTWTGHHNIQVTGEGVYYDSCKTYFGLDSVYMLTVSLHPSYLIEKQVNICANQDYYINGQLVTGNYYRDEQQSINGCDSVTIYYINRAIATVIDQTERFAENTVYSWRNKELTHGGEFYDTLRSQLGCDSLIYHLHLIEEHAYHFIETDTVCLSGSEHYTWRNRLLRESGQYYDSLTTKFGLDSILELDLTVYRDTVVQWRKSLCNGSYYDFFGHLLTEPGTYRSDAFPRTETGCDSIIELILQPVSTEETILRHILCEGDYIVIGDSNVTTTGIYRDTLTSSLGCDSVVKHVVTVGQAYFFSSEAFINEGGSYPWHRNGQPITLNQAGTYWDSCKTVLGCDSIYKLTLRLNQAEYIFPTENDFVCSADLPYVWHHKSLTQTGLYYDSLKTNKGLDSIYSIYLTVYPTIHTREELHFCEGTRAVINGKPYEQDAVFKDTLTSFTGCDSIVDYVLHFHASYNMSFVVYIREGERYQFGDTVITTTGRYSRKFQTQYGCDSIVTIQVNSCPTTQQTIVRHDLCEGEYIVIGGQTITTTGTYYENRTSADGCDSLVSHIVNVHTAYMMNTSASICRGSSYTWYGHHHDTVLTKQGVYYDSLRTQHGCDSIYRLILNYKRTDIKDTVISICRGDLPYIHNGHYYFRDSVFIDTLGMNTVGCDSILRWDYRINEHCSDYVSYNRCVGQTINIDGLLISKEGAYEQHHLTYDGKDSLYRFIVHDVKNYEFTTRVRGCDSIEYDGKTYYARGMGQETFTVDLYHRTVEGCDSLEHLELTIYKSSPARPYSAEIADYDSVPFGPYYYNTTGTYALHYTNAKGCDSTEILYLTVLKTEYPEMEHHYICKGDPKGVEIFGRHYYPTQDYTYISDTTWIAGKPVIRTADITVQYPFAVSSFDPQADQIVCSDHEVLFYVNYSTVDRSILPDYYDVDFMIGDLEAHPLHQTGNVDGKTTLPILMNGQGKYVSPGYYRYRLKLRSEACVVSDTILEGSIVIRYPENIMESAWDDVVMLVNEKYNGGSWVFLPPYKWQVLSEQGVDKTARVVDNATQPYLYSSALEEGDRISATLIREGYDRPVPSCEYIFKPTLAVAQHAILLYPNAVKAYMPVTISSAKAGSYRLYDYTGHLYQTGAFFNGETQVTMPGVAGCYIMVMEDENGKHQTQKLIVY